MSGRLTTELRVAELSVQMQMLKLLALCGGCSCPPGDAGIERMMPGSGILICSLSTCGALCLLPLPDIYGSQPGVWPGTWTWTDCCEHTSAAARQIAPPDGPHAHEEVCGFDDRCLHIYSVRSP